MNSRERVYAAIRREPVDRMPRYLWVGDGAADNLARAYGAKKEDIDFFVGNDVLQCWLSINKQMSVPCEEHGSFVDEWGITWHRDGYYNAVTEHPMAGLDAEAISTYPLPDPYDPQRYAAFRRLKETYGDEYFIGADVSGSLFEPAYHLRGMEQLMLDMAAESEEADILLDRLCEFTTAVAVEAVRLGADWIWLGDDMGTQISMLMSPAMWRTYFRPRMKKIIDAVRAVKPDMIIAYHSCGSIAPIIGELADIGINVLNPLQESAVGMNHRAIKEQYGDRLTFMCGLDTQTFLVSASAEETEQAMREEIALMSRGGGYIAAVSHTLQHDVPPENILAIVRAIEQG